MKIIKSIISKLETLTNKVIRKIFYIYLNNPFISNPIRHRQQYHLSRLNIQQKNLVVIFLAPSLDEVNGGIMSILDLARESRAVLIEENAVVCVCNTPWHPPLERFTKFTNTEALINFKDVISTLSNPCSVIIHVPEIFTNQFSIWLETNNHLLSHLHLSVNILLQNIDLLPEKRDVYRIMNLTSLTCTTAHEAYTNTATMNHLGCSVKCLSVWISPEKYTALKTHQKDKLIIYSPDFHEHKSSIIKTLKQSLHEYSFIEIRNLPYEEYLSLAARATLSISFGEGLDAYFIESVFLGGIGCTVFNNRFFTQKYLGVPFIYASWNELAQKLGEDIRHQIESNYVDLHSIQYRAVSQDYCSDSYRKRIKEFYTSVMPNTN